MSSKPIKDILKILLEKIDMIDDEIRNLYDFDETLDLSSAALFADASVFEQNEVSKIKKLIDSL